MTDITKLAREILRECNSFPNNDMTPFGLACKQLAQAVIKQEPISKAILDQAKRGCMCLIDEDDNILKYCGLHTEELENAKAEQREKDAELAGNICHGLPGSVQCDWELCGIIAKAIREND